MTRPYCVLVCSMIPYKFKGAGVPVSCILALCVGKSYHCTLYHNLARLTIYGTTAKWPIYVSGHWYRILQNPCNMLQPRLPNMEVVSARLSQCK